MKNLIKFSLFLLFAVSAFVGAYAQKTLTDATITYNLKMDEGDPMAGMLGNTNLVLTFKGSLMKTSINLMGGMMTMNIVMDATAKKGVMAKRAASTVITQPARSLISASRSDLDRCLISVVMFFYSPITCNACS